MSSLSLNLSCRRLPKPKFVCGLGPLLKPLPKSQLQTRLCAGPWWHGRTRPLKVLLHGVLLMRDEISLQIEVLDIRCSRKCLSPMLAVLPAILRVNEWWRMILCQGILLMAFQAVVLGFHHSLCPVPIFGWRKGAWCKRALQGYRRKLEDQLKD